MFHVQSVQSATDVKCNGNSVICQKMLIASNVSNINYLHIRLSNQNKVSY